MHHSQWLTFRWKYFSLEQIVEAKQWPQFSAYSHAAQMVMFVYVTNAVVFITDIRRLLFLLLHYCHLWVNLVQQNLFFFWRMKMNKSHTQFTGCRWGSYFPTLNVEAGTAGPCGENKAVRHMCVSARRLQGRQVPLGFGQECWSVLLDCGCWMFSDRASRPSCWADLTHQHRTVCPWEEWSIRKNDGGRERALDAWLFQCLLQTVISFVLCVSLSLCLFAPLPSHFSPVPFIFN